MRQLRDDTTGPYAHWFERAASVTPRAWQRELGEDAGIASRMVRIPTGFGKTLGVLGAWLYHRVERDDDAWPRRLVWCLPMRVLVEQTEHEVRGVLERLGVLWDGKGSHARKVGVHVLMGGVDASKWHLHPEHCAVLIGTQDMLLSRALNRGYAAHRAHWPIDFGLLHQDSLWVMDEVQLMDVGLATSGQLQAFRDEHASRGRSLRPCVTWWMSATLQRAWLGLSPETEPMATALQNTSIPRQERIGHLWDDVQKPMRVEQASDAKAIAKLAADAHLAAGAGREGPTLVVVNRVESAVVVHKELRKHKGLANTERCLIHSRFRPLERATWRSTILNRGACGPGTDRIIVATQVVEAGVDVSAAVLVTELAPWPSLVQRFGRAARWGGRAEVLIADMQHKDDRSAAPYSKSELDAARAALERLDAVAPLQLEAFEEGHQELLAELYPYAPNHLVLRHEVDDLFDTTPDLSGADVDISRFIRSGDERDLQVFWQEFAKSDAPDRKLRASRDALCAVPFLKAREWLCGKDAPLRREMRAWVWDWLDGSWRRPERRDLYPGQTVLVSAGCGGYDPELGWSPDSRRTVPALAVENPTSEDIADASQDGEELSVQPQWQTIATHGKQVGDEAARLASVLCPGLDKILDLAGRWHDAGKAHEAFQNSIESAERPLRRDLAKAPQSAWLSPRRLYPDNNGNRRPSFRHELASTLGLFAVLIRAAPDHPALLGPWRDLLGAAHMRIDRSARSLGPNALEREVLALSAEEFDLLAYLVCSHHGKIRVALHASPADQEASDTVLRIRGIRDGETLPSVTLATADGNLADLPESELHLAPAGIGLNAVTGRGWTERVLGLLRLHSPFKLAYLEALLRIADQRASAAPVADPLLGSNTGDDGLERGHRALAQAAPGGAATNQLAPNSGQGRPEHGIRGRAGGPSYAGARAGEARASTRYVETTRGLLSYADLAPRVALQVQALEAHVALGSFRHRPLDEALIRELHDAICGELLPTLAGRWRTIDVQVGSHVAPSFVEVPMLMRNYCLDLGARLAALAAAPDDSLLECLAFAEGRLLSIHPFEDFNGRVTRVFLAELLGRLALPAVGATPRAGTETERYLRALGAADRQDWEPLAKIWRQRFEQEDTE